MPQEAWMSQLRDLPIFQTHKWRHLREVPIPSYYLIVTSWETPSQAAQSSRPRIPDAQSQWEIKADNSCLKVNYGEVLG
jgi:hypothetical protein